MSTLKHRSLGGSDGRKKKRALQVLALAMLCVLIFSGNLARSSPEQTKATSLTRQADGSVPPSVEIKLQRSGSENIGLAAWQKTYSYSTRVGGEYYGTQSSEMLVNFSPIGYTWDNGDQPEARHYFTMHFGLNVRTAVRTGDELYGGTDTPFLAYNDFWGHHQYEPLAISQVFVEGILLPTDGRTSQQPTDCELVIKGAGTSRLEGHYECLNFDQPPNLQWQWHTTGDYQTSDDYTTWANQVIQSQGTYERIQVISIPMRALVVMGIPYLSPIAGAGGFLLGTLFKNTPFESKAHAIGSILDRDRLSWQWFYGGGSGQTPSDINYAYGVTQANNYLDVVYSGYYNGLQDAQNPKILRLTIRVYIASAYDTAYGPMSAGPDPPGFPSNPFPSVFEYMEHTFDVQLNPNEFAPAFTDTQNPSPVLDLNGHASSQNAVLNWRSDYYNGDNDWIRYYEITDGVNTWTLENIIGNDPFQNNLFTTNQGVGTKTYTVVAKDPTGLASEGRSVTVTTLGPPPTIQITDPPGDTTFYGPVSYTFHASATDPTYGPSGITTVEMYCEDINGPGYLPVWHSAIHGSGTDWYYTFYISSGTTYEVGARVTNVNGQFGYSAAIYVLDVALPTFTYTPPDITVQTRDQFTLKWTATSDDPNNYVIRLGSTQVDSGYWYSSADILYTTSQPNIGTYMYTITIYDTAGYSRSDSVTVTVADNAAPVFFIRPGSLTFERGTTGHTLTWQAGDHNTPGTYSITYYPEGHPEPDIWASASWTNSTMIMINVDSLPAATWYFTCTVTDAYGNSAPSTVTVTVQLVPPTFTYVQPDISVETGQSFTLRWRAADGAPSNYVVKLGGSQVASGTWSNGADITYTYSLGSTGTYTYTITVYDNVGGSTSDSVTVSVLYDANKPVFTYTQPNIGRNVGSAFTLKWTATDKTPNYYVITRNGVEVARGSWSSGVSITYTTTLYSTGTYYFTCTVYDQYGRASSATATVTIRNYQ